MKNSVDSLYTILTVGDPTTAAKAFIEQLEAEKSKLENQVAEDIATAFEKGKSDEQYGTIHGVLQTIKMQVVTIGASREQGYVDAVKTDNQTRYNSFNSAVEDMRNCYIEAVNVIGQVSKVQTPALLNVVKSAVETANTSIQNYLQEINNIENEAFAAFSEAQNTDKMLFDPDKQYEADVRAYEGKIDQILNTMDATGKKLRRRSLPVNMQLRRGCMTQPIKNWSMPIMLRLMRRLPTFRLFSKSRSYQRFRSGSVQYHESGRHRL